ncbi:hypothetical protein FTO74_01155 [Granulicella sp. WH15]|uniref:hypothetical protein n=1 Tax=Granulicella sp. WH15 TaxID=2602070 RepID=UPI0013678F24|nr:hypothetical protein [Granulicella sp. WH15]QHN02142.1 hypothetical protein FTO74_01155 [Granulicella sp. WH15]
MDTVTKAIVEFRKDLLNSDITALECQANVLALKATLLALGGPDAATLFEHHFQIERGKLVERIKEFQTAAQTLQTIIEKSVPASPEPPIN